MGEDALAMQSCDPLQTVLLQHSGSWQSTSPSSGNGDGKEIEEPRKSRLYCTVLNFVQPTVVITYSFTSFF